MADIQVAGLSSETSLVTIKDISSRWRMESHVQRLMTALDCTPDMVFMTDTEFRIVFINPAFHSVTGHTIEDALGRRADFLRAGGQETIIEQYTNRLREGRDWTGEILNIHADGHAFPVHASISPIYDRKGTLLGYASFERDVSSYKRLQQQLLNARDHALSIINSLDSAVYTMDRDFRLNHINDGWRKMPRSHGGITLDEPPSSGKDFLDYVKCAKRRKQFQEIFEEVLDSGESQELRLDTKGKEHWVVRIAPWQQEGENVGIIFLVNDETRYQLLQKQLYQSQKMETIGALAAGVAHDFNNLLQAVRGNTGLLLGDTSLPGPVHARLESIDKAASRAAQITQQLLSFSRASDDKNTVLNICDVMLEALELANRNHPDIQIRKSLPEQELLVCMDGTHAQQVFLNLLVNAFDAMPEGGTLSLSAVKAHLDDNQSAKAKVKTGAPFVCCQVKDTGQGIPSENLERIFQPFFTTKDQGKGTGIGLSVVQNVVHQAGGFIEIHSYPEDGTSFDVYLPLKTAGKPPATPRRSTEINRGSGTVLVVDDLDLVLDFTRSFLESAGYTVLTASSPEKALEIFEGGETVDLLFTDYNMGSMNGLQLINEVSRKWPQTRFVLASGFLEEDEREEIEAEHGTRILNKPFNISEAAEVVSDLMKSGVSD